MSRFIFLTLCTVTWMAGISLAHAADCKKPTVEVTVPDGSTASEAVMIAASKDIRAFVNDGQAYVDCLQPSIDAAAEAVKAAVKDSDEHKAVSKDYLILISEHDTMVKAMQDLAGDFNTALRSYNARAE